MAVQINAEDYVGEVAPGAKIIAFPVAPTETRVVAGLDYRHRRSLSQRRRRAARVRQAAEVAAWTGGSVALLMLGGAELLGLR